MPDNKYRRDNDKIGYLGIEKYRIIDLLENIQELPETDIYDEPVRYFKANLKWTPIIFGWLTIIQELAGWQIADDENHRGIQGIRIFEEGITLVTPIEMQDAITEGMYKAINDVAKQIVSGVRSGFVVDEDGNVTTGGAAGEDAGLPEDDPLTIIDETEASRAGGATAVRQGINQLLADLNGYFGVDAVPDTPLADTQFFINSKYQTDTGLMNAAIAEYYARRETPADVFISIATMALDSALYCKGISKQTINTVIIADLILSAGAKINAVALVDALLDAQIDSWFDKGADIPTTAYFDYSCVPIPDESFSVNWNDTHTTNGIQKKNHRYLVHSSGLLTDPDGDTQDTWYYVPSGGDPVFNSNHMNVLSTGFTADPTAAQVPYRTDHVYEWTYERDDNHTVDFNPVRNAGMNAASTGSLTITVKDLGEFLA